MLENSIMNLLDDVEANPLSYKGSVVGQYVVAAGVHERLMEILHTMEGLGESHVHFVGEIRELAKDVEGILSAFRGDIHHAEACIEHMLEEQARAAKN